MRGVSKDCRGHLWPILRGSPKYAMREHRGGERLRMTAGSVFAGPAFAGPAFAGATSVTVKPGNDGEP